MQQPDSIEDFYGAIEDVLDQAVDPQNDDDSKDPGDE